jgi:hypothetical protein
MPDRPCDVDYRAILKRYIRANFLNDFGEFDDVLGLASPEDRAVLVALGMECADEVEDLFMRDQLKEP